MLYQKLLFLFQFNQKFKNQIFCEYKFMASPEQLLKKNWALLCLPQQQQFQEDKQLLVMEDIFHNGLVYTKIWYRMRNWIAGMDKIATIMGIWA